MSVNLLRASIAGFPLVAVGAFVPSSTLIGLLRETPPDLEQRLLQGALCLRAVLVALGIGVVLLAWFYERYPGPRESGAVRSRSSTATPWILLAILGAAAALRLIGLGEGLWFDEIVTQVRYVRLAPGEIVSTFDFQNQHFFYTLLASLAQGLFGESAWSLRIPAAAFGVASVWALYVLAARLLGARIALLASGLLAASYHHVWFSQNARGYIGLLFFTLLSSWLLLRALDTERPRSWLAYAVVVALGMYTHMTMLFVVAGHLFVWALDVMKRRAEPWPARATGFLYGFCVSGLLTLLLYALVLPQMFGGTLAEGGAVDTWKNPLWALLETVRGLRMALPGGAIGMLALGVAVGGLLVFGLGCLRLWRECRVLLWLFLVPVAVTAIVALARGHHLWPRLFFFAMGFGVLIAIRGTLAAVEVAARFVPALERRATAVGTGLVLLLIAMSALTIPRAWAPKQDYRGALEFVERERAPGDAVVTVGLASVPYEQYFGVDWRPVESPAELERIRADAGATWLVYTLGFQLEAVHPEMMRAVEQDFVVVERFWGTLGGGEIIVCRDTAAAAELFSPR
jgi:4-amino-4-deoxy-L-arabinose transferase-like glycosyltransferase